MLSCFTVNSPDPFGSPCSPLRGSWYQLAENVSVRSVPITTLWQSLRVTCQGMIKNDWKLLFLSSIRQKKSGHYLSERDFSLKRPGWLTPRSGSKWKSRRQTGVLQGRWRGGFLRPPAPCFSEDRRKDQGRRGGVKSWRAVNGLRLSERKHIPVSWKTGPLATHGMRPFYFYSLGSWLGR